MTLSKLYLFSISSQIDLSEIQFMKKILPILVVTLTLTLGTAVQAAQYTVGVEDLSYYPHYTTENGEYRGFARALLDAFAKDNGHTLVYKKLPVNRLFAELIKGGVDLKYPDNAYWSKEMKAGSNVTYSEPIVEYIDGASVKPAAKGKGVDAISKLGTVRGFTAWSWMGRIDAKQVSVSENNSLEGLIKQGIKGRVDAVYGNVAVIRHQLSELKLDGQLVFDESLPHSKDFYYMSTTTKPKLIDEFNAWLASNTDKVSALKQQYKIKLD